MVKDTISSTFEKWSYGWTLRSFILDLFVLYFLCYCSQKTRGMQFIKRSLWLNRSKLRVMDSSSVFTSVQLVSFLHMNVIRDMKTGHAPESYTAFPICRDSSTSGGSWIKKYESSEVSLWCSTEDTKLFCGVMRTKCLWRDVSAAVVGLFESQFGLILHLHCNVLWE